MITILTTVEVQSGREEDFEALWRDVHHQEQHYPGLRTDRLLRDTDQRRRYVIVIEWDNREQFDAYMRAAGMLWLLDATDHWMAPPSWSYLEEIAEAAPTS